MIALAFAVIVAPAVAAWLIGSSTPRQRVTDKGSLARMAALELVGWPILGAGAIAAGIGLAQWIVTTMGW